MMRLDEHILTAQVVVQNLRQFLQRQFAPLEKGSGVKGTKLATGCSTSPYSFLCAIVLRSTKTKIYSTPAIALNISNSSGNGF